MTRSLLAILAAGILAAPAISQTTVASINTYVKGIDRYARRAPKVLFADVSDYENSRKAEWRKFASEKALEKHREASEAYSIAYTWSRGGRLVAANFTLFSPSGDWTKYVNHYFRSDGTLAKVEVDYRTFHGDFIVEQNIYYGPTGKLLRITTAYKDLQTGKPKKPEAGYLDDNSDLLAGDIYKRIAKLPFAGLIK
jgi:hypothetical protein